MKQKAAELHHKESHSENRGSESSEEEVLVRAKTARVRSASDRSVLDIKSEKDVLG